MFQKHPVGIILYWEMYVNVVSTSLCSSLFLSTVGEVSQQNAVAECSIIWTSTGKHAGGSLGDPQIFCKWTMSFVGLKCKVCSDFEYCLCVLARVTTEEFFRTVSVESTWVSFYLTSASLRAQLMELANEAWVLYHVSLKVHSSNAKLRTNENPTRAVSQLEQILLGQILCTLQNLWK